MALDYSLAVIGDTDPLAMAERLGFSRDAFEVSRRSVWTAVPPNGLFILTLRSAEDGYFQHDEWEYEPEKYLHVGFRLDKFRSVEAMAVLHSLVGRALATGGEDMVFLGPDGDVRFHRVDGVVRRSHQLVNGVRRAALQALVDDVALYYLSGEVDFDDHDDLRARADGSARSLAARHPSGVARSAAVLLREAAAAPGHPVFRAMEETAQFGWDDDARTLAAFTVLAHAIADRIDTLVP